MGLDRESTNAICALCKGPSGGENRSSEHITLAALGGRRTVSGFICRTCNSDTGNTWDAALANDLEDLARLLAISRQRGSVQSKMVYTSQAGLYAFFGATNEDD